MTFIVTVPLVSAVLIVEVTVNDQHLISQTQSLSSTPPPPQLLGYIPQTSYEFHHKILGEDQKEATQLKGERERERERERGGEKEREKERERERERGGGRGKGGREREISLLLHIYHTV